MKALDIEKLEKSINEVMYDDIASCRIAGASVLVFQESEKGNVRFERCYGKRNTDTKEDMTSDTVFRLASMTKPVTAAAVLKEAEHGNLSLYDRVDSYLPAFRDMKVGREENGKAVPDHICEPPLLIWHLLTHVNGLMTGNPVCMLQEVPIDENTTLEKIADYYGKSCLLGCDPMREASYSPTAAFDVAARIVEVTSGLCFEEYVQKELFLPLEMYDTTFIPNAEKTKRMAAMHSRTEDGKNITVPMEGHNFENFPLGYTCGGAGLASTVIDYSHFADMLLHEGEYKGRTVLRSESVKLMKRPWVPYDTKGVCEAETWGLGVRAVGKGAHLPCGSFGWSGAYGTHFWVDPENRLYAVYAKNSRFDGGSGAHTAYVFEECVMNALE